MSQTFRFILRIAVVFLFACASAFASRSAACASFSAAESVALATYCCTFGGDSALLQPATPSIVIAASVHRVAARISFSSCAGIRLWLS